MPAFLTGLFGSDNGGSSDTPASVQDNYQDDSTSFKVDTANENHNNNGGGSESGGASGSGQTWGNGHDLGAQHQISTDYESSHKSEDFSENVGGSHASEGGDTGGLGGMLDHLIA